MTITKKKDRGSLNVLMVTPRYFPYMGGTETHVYEVGRRLVQNGVEVTILTTAPYMLTPPLPEEEVIEGMRIIRVQAWPSQRDYYIAPEMYSIIVNGGWDIIHCQGCHTFIPPLAMLAAKRAGIPYVVTFHSGGHSSRFRTRIRGIQWRVLRPLFARASKLIGVSHFEADYFRNLLCLPTPQFAVIPNGITIPSSAHLPLYETSKPLIISVGRLEQYKGHQRLITALPKIREQLPTAHLLVLGKGPYEATLRQLAQHVGVAEHVAFRSVPAENRQGMMELLSQASLVALLSAYEAHPVAIMEALALRRPVLVANTSGLRELVEQHVASAVSLESTPEEIATAVVKQIKQPLTLPPLTLSTWEQCTQQLQDVYSILVRKEQCVS